MYTTEKLAEFSLTLRPEDISDAVKTAAKRCVLDLLGAARDFSKLPTLSTDRWCAYGAAAAAGRLRRLTASVLSQALAIAGSQIPDLAASGYSQVMGNHVKEGIPWSTMLGLMAVDLAQDGFTGPLDILDDPDYFNPDLITDMLISARAIENIYFKPYSSCRLWMQVCRKQNFLA